MTFSSHKSIALLLTVTSVLAACGGSSSGGGAAPMPPPPAPTRSFYMGFTPWPYDATQAAVDDVNQRIQDNGDIVDHHIMVGVPWEEALQGLPYHPNVDADLTARVQMVQPGKEVFLAIDSLSGVRDAMAANWGENFNEPLPPPWDTRGFADAEVATAYLSFSLDLIARFDPAYFNYGTEVSELMLNDPAAFDDYVTFAETVYNGIKARHPNLPVMVSIAFKSPGSAEMAAIAAGTRAIRTTCRLTGWTRSRHWPRANPWQLPRPVGPPRTWSFPLSVSMCPAARRFNRPMPAACYPKRTRSTRNSLSGGPSSISTHCGTASCCRIPLPPSGVISACMTKACKLAPR
jgi:hypothetical protein